MQAYVYRVLQGHNLQVSIIANVFCISAVSTISLVDKLIMCKKYCVRMNSRMCLAPELKDFWLLGGWFCLAGGILPSELSSRQNRCHPDWARTQVWIGGNRPDLLGRRLVNNRDTHRQEVPVCSVVELGVPMEPLCGPACPSGSLADKRRGENQPFVTYDLSRASQLSCREALSCLFCRWESGL